jgi:dTDP-4-dehydrorhamnose 3,5-epimerase
MQISELGILGSWLFTPRQFEDDRGVFLEWFRGEDFSQALGHRLNLAQANLATSRRGTLRGVHFADVPPGQAKYVTCLYGSVLDVVVDLRLGSATFGQHVLVPLDDQTRAGVYLSEGLGHAYLALTEGAVVGYLCSTPYAPEREHGVNPLCPKLGIDWPSTGADGQPITMLLSPKDEAAPGLEQAQAAGLLPTLVDVDRHLAELRAQSQ